MSFSRNFNNSRFIINSLEVNVNANITLKVRGTHIEISGNWTKYELTYSPLTLNFTDTQLIIENPARDSFVLKTNHSISDTEIFQNCGVGCWSYNATAYSPASFHTTDLAIILIWIINFIL
eukprot:NODE_13_length_54415_cov_0.522424.p48 type:complete len:121 gc:universal NODE_13_length_54415_cov_0.522424:14878-15240(+)